MNRGKLLVTAAAVTAALLSAPALGGIIVTQGASAPTYGTTLDFDEPGGPTGSVATDAWAASHGVLALDSGDLNPEVDAYGDLYGQPWLGTGNAFYGNFGVFMTFADDLTALSMQIWDPSGPPSPFGGGASIFVFNDGQQVGTLGFGPAWGGVGDEWLDVTATEGDLFDEVRILGWGMGPTTYADNFSWNVVPEPTAASLLVLCGFAAVLRRR